MDQKSRPTYASSRAEGGEVPEGHGTIFKLPVWITLKSPWFFNFNHPYHNPFVFICCHKFNHKFLEILFLLCLALLKYVVNTYF